MREKMDFTWQSATISSVAGPRRSSKPLPKAKLAPKNCHGHCLVVCCQSDPLWLSESQWNHYTWEVCSANQWDILKTAMPAAGIGQQKDPNSSPWQCPTACCTINASKIEWNQAKKFCLICHIHLTSRPLTTTSSSTSTTFAGKMLPQPAGCRKCFPRVYQIPKHRFLCYKNKQIYSSLGKLCWLPKMVEEWDGETTFSPTNSSKDHLNAEQTPQNNFWTLAEDTRHRERQPIVFRKGGRSKYKR